MSHNKITIENQKPDNTGNIPVNLSGFADIITPSENNILKFDGTKWTNSNTNSNTGVFSNVSVTQRNTSTHSSSGSYSIGHYVMLRRSTSAVHKIQTTGFNLNAATTTNTLKDNTNWLESVDIPNSGNYLCICTLSIENGDMKARWESNDGGFSNYVHVYSNNNSKSGSILLGILNTTSSNNVRVVIKDHNSASYLIDDIHHHALSIHIIKLN